MEQALNHTHILNMFSIAMSDNEVSPEEIETLYYYALQRGIEEKEINRILENPHESRFAVPDDTESKITNLYELASIIYADGRIDVREIQTFRSIAREMGFNSEIAHKLVNRLIGHLQSSTDLETIIPDILSLLQDTDV